ncbi:hypothetical protein ANT_18930 [Anaerolinea thermophila UNI-1]|uniref:Uncharacterized protein n=2 Tax=Anaerolinea thermophila TaxID=167964 RepID=E8N655_ANATU|nr:hypothetical protein ANT_18930 [Anaerolinea thermophila UNI-1]
MKNYYSFWFAAFVIACGVDFLFWGKPIGVSFPLWVLLVMSSAIYLAWKTKMRPARENLFLGVAGFGLALLPLLRAEPFTQVVAVLLTLLVLMLWAATLRTGHWLRYNLWDYIRTVAVLIFEAVTNPFRQQTFSQPHSQESQKSLPRQGWAVLRGILLSLPVLGVLVILLASADLVFAERLQTVFGALRLDKFPETLFRLFYVCVLTVIFCGVLLHTFFPVYPVQPTREKRLFPPFLGWTESSIVLSSVILLFVFFVILQFQYLFGGQANIHEAGFTYAEYARRGFGELVWVALISLMLILSLHAVCRCDTSSYQRGFIFLSSLLIILVSVILASAMQRLILYEQAYGFTRLRTYTHIFIPWLGGLFLAVLGLLITNRMHQLAPVLFILVIGFGLCVGFWNIDGWIARQNVQRVLAGEDLDGEYLQILSADAVPELIRLVQEKGLPESAKEELLIGLACRASQSAVSVPAWQSFNLSEARAQKLLSSHAYLWKNYPIQQDSDGRYVLQNGSPRYCREVRGVN